MDWGFIGFSFYLFNNRCDGVLTSHWYNITTVQYIQPINWKQCALLYWHEKLITSFQKCFKIGPGVELKEFCIVYIHFLNVFLRPPPFSYPLSLSRSFFHSFFFLTLSLSLFSLWLCIFCIPSYVQSNSPPQNTSPNPPPPSSLTLLGDY